MSTNASWHYAVDGDVIGPISLDEVKSLIAAGQIKAETSVWNGEGEWKAAKSTVLGGLFSQPSLAPTAQVDAPTISIQAPPVVPPRPLSNPNADNKFAWLLVAVPIIGMLVDLLTGKSSVWVFIVILFVLNAVFLMQDQKTHKAKGLELSTKGWNNLIPVYLWNRAKQFNQPSTYVWAWVVSFVISILVVFTPNSSSELSAADNAALQQQLNTVMQTPVDTAQESNASTESKDRQ